MQKDIETLISSNLHSGISAVESWQQFFSSTFKLLLLVSLFYHYYGIKLGKNSRIRKKYCLMDVIYLSRSIGKIKHRFVYIPKPGGEIGQSFEESLRGGKQKLFE